MEKNSSKRRFIDVDCTGIIPSYKSDYDYDFAAARKYCDKKGIKINELKLEESNQFAFKKVK